MQPTLPDFPKITIKQDPQLPTESDLEAFDAVVCLLPGEPEALPDNLPWKAFLDARMERFPDRKQPVTTGLPGGGHGVLARIAEGVESFDALSRAGKIVASLLETHPRHIAVLSCLKSKRDAECMSEALLAALHAAIFRMPRIGKAPPRQPAVESLHLHGDIGAPDIARVEATAEGNNLARWLTQLPGNYLTPGIYRGFANALAEREGWKMDFLDRKRLEKLGAGAFLSVVEASPREDAGICHLRYRPPGARGKPLALVGKGICFDTGGSNLKNASGMLGMHGDMGGSAVALGTLLALTRLGFPEPVDCWLALAENHIGERAVRCNDVVTAVDGTTIEIINTDAEGRMVLADTLALAGREEARAILDFATLTGSCVAALGHRMSGGLTNRPDWNLALLETGRDCGERVWPLPNSADYDEDLESPVADIRQCRPPAEADHIYAARFLNRFVPAECGWVHVDMSAGTREGGLAHIPTDTTGFGVRFGTAWMHRLLENQ